MGRCSCIHDRGLFTDNNGRSWIADPCNVPPIPPFAPPANMNERRGDSGSSLIDPWTDESGTRRRDQLRFDGDSGYRRQVDVPQRGRRRHQKRSRMSSRHRSRVNATARFTSSSRSRSKLDLTSGRIKPRDPVVIVLESKQDPASGCYQKDDSKDAQTFEPPTEDGDQPSHISSTQNTTETTATKTNDSTGPAVYAESTPNQASFVSSLGYIPDISSLGSGSSLFSYSSSTSVLASSDISEQTLSPAKPASVRQNSQILSPSPQKARRSNQVETENATAQQKGQTPATSAVESSSRHQKSRAKRPSSSAQHKVVQKGKKKTILQKWFGLLRE